MANTSSILAERTPSTMKRQKDMILEYELPRLESVQYASGKKQTAINNSSRKREANGPKQKWRSVVHMSRGESKVWCCEEQNCTRTWNVSSRNQGKLDIVKQKMARMNISILGISQLKWTGMGACNSGNHYIYNCEQESLRRKGVALMVNKESKYSPGVCKEYAMHRPVL